MFRNVESRLAWVGLFFGLLVVVTVTAEPAGASGWVPCGGEGGTCFIPGGPHVVVRYGADGRYVYSEAKGLELVPCSHHRLGDPNYGTVKSCAYRLINREVSSTYSHCANEGQTCSVGNGSTPKRVRYGAGDRWYSTIQGSDFTCSSGYFGYDPLWGTHKTCQIGSAVLPSQAGGPVWTRCASEGQICHLESAGDLTWIRYGYGSRWEHRLVSAATFECSLRSFGRDPFWGQLKSCDYITNGPSLNSAAGRWQQVSSCQGTQCDDLTFSLSWGVSNRTTEELTTSFTTTISSEISSEFEFGGSTFSVSNAYTTANAMATSIGRTVTQDCSASCAPLDEGVAMWQWKMSFDEECYVSGDCPFTIDSCSYLCLAPGVEPLAPLGCCADADCQVFNDSNCDRSP